MSYSAPLKKSVENSRCIYIHSNRKQDKRLVRISYRLMIDANTKRRKQHEKLDYTQNNGEQHSSRVRLSRSTRR